MFYERNISDFEGKKEEAKKWANERYKNWHDRLLTPTEKNEIKEYMKNKEVAQQINHDLEDSRGNIKEDNKYKETIEKIDKGLKKEKTDQLMYVYQRVSEQFFGLTEGTLRTGININREEFGVFKNFYIDNQSILIENGYIEASLSGESPNLAQEPSIYMKLKVPAGTHGGYTGSLQGLEGNTHDFLLDRGYGLQFTDAKIITQKGKEYIKVEAELLTKEKIEQRIAEYSKELNNELLQSGIETIEDNPLIRLEFNSRYTNYNYEKSKEIIEAIKGLPIDYMELLNLEAKEIAEQHGLKESPNIRITDDYIDGNPKVGGVHHNNGFKRTYISLRGVENIGAELKKVTLHEMGHAIDDMLFQHISDDDDMTKLFKEEKNNFPTKWYGRKNEREYFAECFSMYYSTETKDKQYLKETAPKTYEFIAGLEKQPSRFRWIEKCYIKSTFQSKIELNFHNSICNVYYNKNR
ncbi:hypothetical protein OCE56_24680 [Bacillus cereus]|nr:hypothetical protein [Bacillus cereus]